MRGLALFLHQSLVHLYTKAGLLGQADKAVHELEILGVQRIVQHAAALVVVDADALLLNGRVVAGGIQIQAAGKGHRAKRAVGSKGHIVGFGHGGNLLALGQATGMGKVRLHDVHAANGQQTLEIVLGEQAFTGSNGDVAGRRNLGKILHVIAENGFLNEHGVELFQLFGHDLCHGLVHPAVKINGNAKILAAALTHAGYALQQGIDLGVAVQKLQLVGAGKYDDVKADVTLTMSHQMAASHSINKTAEEFARLVAEKSEGKMKVDVYSAATLGTETENLQALTNGTLDLAVIAAEFYANYVDEAGCLCLPFVYSSYDDCAEKLAGEAGTTVAQMILDKTNVRILDYYVLAFRQIFTTDKPLNTVDDMSGLIIRIPDSSTYKETFTQLGAAPTPVAWGETYTALDTGLVSAVENIPESIMSASMQEVCKYVNVSNHIIGPTTISVSEQVFQKLTEEQQNILTEAAKEACEFGLNATKDGSDANFDALEGAGLEVVDTDVDSLKAKINYNAYACAKTDVGKQILTSMGVAL